MKSITININTVEMARVIYILMEIAAFMLRLIGCTVLFSNFLVKKAIEKGAIFAKWVARMRVKKLPYNQVLAIEMKS